jgi:hypothetical protein
MVWTLAAVLLPAAGAARAQEADRILLDSLSPRPVSYTGLQVTEVRGGKKPGPPQRVYRSATRLRIEFPGGQVVLDDGVSQLRYFPRLGVVERGRSDLNAPRSRFVRKALTTGRAVVERLADDSVAARPTYVVSLKDARGRRSARTVWIDKENSIQLRQDVSRPDGQVVSTYFTRIQFGVEPPAARMQPTWPANTPIVSRAPGRPVPPVAAAEVARAWGGLLVPRNVPSGFRLRGYYQQGPSTRARIFALYDEFSSGKTITVAQRFASPAPVAPVGTGGAGTGAVGSGAAAKKPGRVSANKGQASITVSGPLPEAQLRQILDSLQ